MFFEFRHSGFDQLVRRGRGRGRGREELVDRLMISALIEARSCERFNLLADSCDSDPELSKLYKALWASEHGHYRTFIELAEQIEPADRVAARWEQMLNEEAKIVRRQSPGPRMHSGMARHKWHAMSLGMGDRHTVHPMHAPNDPIDSSRAACLMWRWQDGAIHETRDELSDEEPLEIRVRGRAISVTMRTPGHDDVLAAGLLFTEGIIRAREDILRIAPCERNEFGNTIDVLLAPDVAVDFAKLTRHVFASSSCGVCGKATIDAVRQTIAPIESNFTIDAKLIATLPATMNRAQETFHRTGGLHAAALFDAGGKLLVLREDVGRHNAMDKVIGHALMNRMLPLDRCVLLVSGRTSFEIMQKALHGRIPVIAAVSAPSSLAVRFAEQAGQTLIGFLREGRMNIYTHRRRVIA